MRKRTIQRQAKHWPFPCFYEYTLSGLDTRRGTTVKQALDGRDLRTGLELLKDATLKRLLAERNAAAQYRNDDHPEDRILHETSDQDLLSAVDHALQAMMPSDAEAAAADIKAQEPLSIA